jgi:putative ABC transport system substrate-binding protein
VDRRAFLAGTGAVLLAAPLAAEAKQAAKIYRVGVLGGGFTPTALRESANFLAFRDALAQLGYREGQNLILEVRSAEHQTDLAGPARELVQLKVDVIIAGGVAAARAAETATQSIPIVGVAVGGDPIAMGLAQSIARPGGNFTGFLHAGTEPGKLLQLLKEALPGLTRAGLVWNPDNPVAKGGLENWEAAARVIGLKLRVVQATSIEELEAAFATLTTERVQAAFVVADPLWLAQKSRAAEVALRHRIAAIWRHVPIAEAGGFMALAPDIVDQNRQSAGYVKKILDGAKPGDLPLQFPTKWTLAVNLKTAKALGLTIPPSLLGRADEVIQ